MELQHIQWQPTQYAAFLQQLSEQADPDYQAFQQKLLVSDLPVLGIRLPQLRKLAKEIGKGDSRGFLSVCGTTFHEERLLYGFVSATLPYFEFLPHSDHMAEVLTENWGTCDTFCSSLRQVLSIPENKAHYFDHILSYLSSKNPWALRVGLIIMLTQYLQEDTITEVLQRTGAVQSDFYYVRMAQAWLFATAWAKFRDQTAAYLQACPPEAWTFRKFVQKACESRRISPEDKAYLKSLLPPVSRTSTTSVSQHS